MWLAQSVGATLIDTEVRISGGYNAAGPGPAVPDTGRACGRDTPGLNDNISKKIASTPGSESRLGC